MERAKAEYLRYLYLEGRFWQQKIGYDWFKSSDINTRFFDTIMNGRTNRL